ncbi:MAG: DUF2807 domain-containing protein [Flavobacteriaceae bacterium]|nr:DUF2807 domain-containing protein [Flavobacteriaceae bacterium]MCY4216846.1 DUF2807 domain-containing protein [Flavobacteriaceae bacterium]MCY4253406.1 DUF2807 domain-containing protein [Flavobacteriaceae bacterium]
MKKFIGQLLVLAFIVGPLTLSQAQQEKEVREVGFYHSIKVAGSYKVNLVKGQPGSITLDGSKLSAVRASVKNGTLTIQRKSNLGSNSWRGAIEVTVPIDELNALALSGSGKISNNHTLSSDQLKLSLAGSGKIDLKVHADSIEGSVSGSGGITLSGDTDRVTFSLAGSGFVKASELKADKAIANVSGSGSVNLYASDSFNGNVSGSGSIKCHGTPDKQNQKVSGSGRISFVD